MSAFVGAFENVVIGVREDLNYAVSRAATLVDDAGVIQVSAFQDDCVVVRIFARFACTVAKPLGADGLTPSTPVWSAHWSPPPEGEGPEETRGARAGKAIKP